MEAKVVKVGTSVGLVIPKFIAVEGGFSQGTPVNIEFCNEQIIVTRRKNVRDGWAAAFAKYAKEGEDDLLIPDCVDNEVDALL